MTDELFARAKQVFLEACDLPSAERSAFLDRVCGADEKLRREVTALLDYRLPTDSQAAAGGPEEPPEPIPNFSLVKRIGGGGMGEVWEAEQLAPVRRRVALKLIRPGVSGKDLPARFEAERQALALMNHVNIATVFEAGSTPRGRPYFAMELVEGVPITDYCDSHRLDLRQRLALFFQACAGVQHAHHKGVIHRDIKPPNVLVADEGVGPVVKVIDFGVAKATSLRLTERTLRTEQGQWLGTPEYMSPEQAGLTEADVDTRTDVYALGVVLYELLVGRLPFEASTLRDGGFGEMCRILREEDPPRPSTRVTSPDRDPETIARERHTDSGTLARQLRGDLDWIVMKTLEKEQGRRYGSPAELAEDIRRHLRNEPVLARPPSAWYRLRKLAARNRVTAAAVSLMLASLGASAIGTSIGMVRARREADAAQRVAETMVTVLRTLNPAAPIGPMDSAHRALDRGVAEIDEKLGGQPLVRGRLLTVIGQAYNNLGAFDKARAVLDEARAVWTEELPADDPAFGELHTTLGWNHFWLARYDDACASFERAVAIHERSSGEEDAATGWALSNLGLCLWRVGEYEGSLSALDRAEQILASRHGADSGAVAGTLHFKGTVLSFLGDREGAKGLLERSVAIYERELGKSHAAVVRPVAELGRVCSLLGESARAEQLLRRALEIGQATFGGDHFVTALPLRELGALESRRGDLEAARRHLRRALEIEERALGPNHPDVVWTLRVWSRTLSRGGDYAGARSLLERALSVAENALGPNHLEVATSLESLGYLEYLLERFAEARKYYERAQIILLRLLGPRHRWAGLNWYQQACLAAREGDPAAAITLLRRVLDTDWASDAVFEDPDLEVLRGDPEFEAILGELRRRLDD